MNYDTWKSTNPADNELGRSDGTPLKHRCVTCDWRGAGSIARAEHWKATGHVVVYADDPRFKPYALFAFDWPEVGPQFHVIGGPHDKSTVSAETLRELGIPVREERR